MAPSIALIIPTYNAEKDIPALFAGISSQTLQPDIILMIDSSSTDNTRLLLKQYPLNIMIHTIPQQEFDHGGTRRLGTELVDADVYILMTQDAYPAYPNTFEKLIENLFLEEKIGCAFGRQLPKSEANPLSIHGRLFNYPEKSLTKYYADRKTLGIKTCFNSDNLAAYKKQALQAVGGFPQKLLTAEDAYVAAKLLMHGFAIRYAADAIIYHSHNLSLKQELHRYFSIGVFHQRQNWIIKEFNSANSEGMRFILSEMRFLLQRKKYLWFPQALASTIVKFIGYKIDSYESFLPTRLKKTLGVNQSYWK